MLQKLVDRISRGGSFSTVSLAREFGVSAELMEAMLEDLVRAGYLQPLNTDCGGKDCGRCGTAASCKPRAKTWMLARRNPSE